MSTAGCTRKVPDRLILMRHAKSDYPAGVPDHERPLNARGRRDATAARRWLAEHLDALTAGRAVVLVSSAQRAQQTWAIAGEGLGVAALTEPRIYEASVSTILDLADAAGADTVVIVGHNPTLESCGEHLARDWGMRAMKTCSIAALELDPQERWGSGTAELLAFATPRAD